MLQIAIAKFFDGEAPDPLEEARVAQAVPPPTLEPRRREVLQNGFGRPPRSNILSQRELAPRVVPPQGTSMLSRPPLLLAILFTPFNLLYQLFSKTFGYLGIVAPFRRFFTDLGLVRSLPPKPDTAGRIPLSPKETALRFSREFQEAYQRGDLNFHPDGYAQAYDLAKKEVKFLLVVLLSPSDDDTEAFVRGTLLSDIALALINDPQNKIVLWGGTVQDAEAYEVAKALRCEKFPFAALIARTPQDSSTSMSILARISGSTSATTFVARLRSAISHQQPALERARATKDEQQASRNLRSEQNSAYERSLAQDRERARQKREAQAAQLRAEQEEKAALEAEGRKQRNIEQWRVWRARSIKAEPATASKDTSRVSIRLTSGERVVRRFDSQAPVEELYAFIDCYDILRSNGHTAPVSKPEGYAHAFDFRLVSPMPRTVYDSDSSRTIGGTIGRNGNLIVESIDGEDDDE